MEKVGIAVVGGLILIILIVGWANRGSREDESNRQRGGEAELQLNKSGENDSDGVVIDDDEAFDMSGPGESGLEIEGEGEVVSGAGESGRDDVLPAPSGGDSGPEPMTPNPEWSPTLVKHKLKPGETISHLALKYLGGVQHWKAIVAENPGLDPARVRAGTEIIIPNRAKLKEKVAATPTAAGRSARPAAGRPSFIKAGYIDNYLTQGGAERPSSAQPLAKGQYRVKKGDTLGAIAQKQLGSARLATKIYEANRDLMKNPNDLRVGWVLQIPGID